MGQFLQPSWHLSRRVELPVGDAADALDDLVRREHGRAHVPHLRFGTRAAVASHAAPFVARRWYGRLHATRFGGWVPVELELTAWSSTQSQLGLRPTRVLPARHANGYFTTGTDCIAKLGSALTSVRLNHQEFDQRRVA